MFPIYDALQGILIPLILVAVFGVIVIAVILIKRHVSIFKSDEKPKSDREIAAEELDRLLQPIEDEEAAAQVNSYSEEEEGKPAEEVKPAEEKPAEAEEEKQGE